MALSPGAVVADLLSLAVCLDLPGFLLADKNKALVKRQAVDRALVDVQLADERRIMRIITRPAVAALAVQVHVLDQLLEEREGALLTPAVAVQVAGVQVLDHVIG